MRIVVCPLASPGFSFPTIAVARELVRRGHEVRTVAGLDTSAWHDPRAVATHARALERAFDEQRPDVLLSSALALAPLIVGERAGLPVVVIGLLTDLLPAQGSRRAEFQAAFDAARAGLGLPEASVDRMLGDLYLPRGVPQLGCGPQAIGACAWEPPASPEVLGWLDRARRDGRRVVYVHQARGFGAPGFWPLLAEALPPDVVVAASTSRMDAAVGSPRPGSLLGPMVPQGVILQRASAVLCSGTTAVAVGALAEGLPIVTLPAGSEQHDVAALIEGAGLGVSVPARQATAAGLRDALERAWALDPDPRREIRAAFAQVDGPSRAADLITWR